MSDPLIGELPGLPEFEVIGFRQNEYDEGFYVRRKDISFCMSTCDVVLHKRRLRWKSNKNLLYLTCCMIKYESMFLCSSIIATIDCDYSHCKRSCGPFILGFLSEIPISCIIY